MQPEIGDILQRIKQGERIRPYETTRIHKDGHKILVAITVSPIKDAKGQVTGASAITRDISDRRQTEERLLQAQKLESIGLLSGGVAHDFNNLLTVIMSSATCILEQRPTCHHSQDILAASGRAAELTRQLLAFAGKSDLVVKVLDLGELVAQSKGLLAASVPKRVALNFHFAENLPRIEADPSRIEQIVMNLVINASEAMPARTDGVITVTTSVGEVTPEMARQQSRAGEVVPGTYVCLEVRDNGSGMEEATVQRIFEPFFTTKFTGRGIGRRWSMALFTVPAALSQSKVHWALAPSSGCSYPSRAKSV